MELISETAFPSQQYSCRRGIRSRSGGISNAGGCLSLSIGSQWIRYLPDQGNRSRWSRHRLFRILRFPVGQHSGRRGTLCRSGGLSNAGATYLYQLEANGSSTYLTKVTAPDGAAGDYFGFSVSQLGNITAVGATLCRSGGAQ